MNTVGNFGSFKYNEHYNYKDIHAQVSIGFIMSPLHLLYFPVELGIIMGTEWIPKWGF